MTRVCSFVLLAALPMCAQHRVRLAEYAVVLDDEPVVQKLRSRALTSAAGRSHLARIESAQRTVRTELIRRNIPVTAADQILVNALIVTASPETAASIRAIPGVKYVVAAPPAKMALDRAADLMHATEAWNSAPGGAGNAGAGIKIGIIDSGIDQTHPGFQDPSLNPPAGFPKGDAAYTNGKVIVARSYVPTLAVGFFADPNDFAATSRPDDYTPRDRTGHGTAIAMIAAGTQNTGPLGTIRGIAPKAYLGNYKIFGSPGVNDFTSFAAFDQALKDALSDGMDVVTVSLTDSVFYGPLDIDPPNPPAGCGGACDVYSQAVESAVAAGMVVVVPAGNDGALGTRGQALASIRRPGTAPSAITVGASINSHTVFQTLHIAGTGVPGDLQNIRGLFSDGPRTPVPTAPIKDVAALGNDGLACAGLPAGSLAGSIALIQRGTCDYTTKIVNAQSAGAIGAVIYQSSGIDTIDDALSVQTTGIPSMMIGNTNGVALKAYLSSSRDATATMDSSLAAAEAAPNGIWPASSRGPSPGTFANTATNVIKPELVAVGTNIYTATQALDPNGAQYNSSRYTVVGGTSAAVPMIAGAVALVKQKNPRLTPAQIKSAVVNTASQDVTDASGVARINSTGAGKLNLADAVRATASLEPATIEFGLIAAGALPISRTLRITNAGSALGIFTLAVQQRDTDIRARVQVSQGTLTLQPGQQSDVTVTLSGTQPTAGSYEGFIVVTSLGPTLRIPYQYLVSSGVPADIFPLNNGSFVGGVNQSGWGIALRAVDSFGIPVVGTPVQFSMIQGDSTLDFADQRTFLLGNAGADLTLGPTEGDQIFRATVAGMTLQFNGFARALPSIPPNSVVNAASNQFGNGLAPGSYISIYGTALADATQNESTASLPVSLSGVSVSFDADGISQPGHLHFISPGQINVQIPWEFQGKSSVKIKVTIGDLQSAVYTLPLAAYSPALFPHGDFAAAQDANFADINPDHPARRGDVILLYANGLGAVSNQPRSGEPSGASETTSTPSVTIGGINAPVRFSGMTPDSVGLYQVNVMVPADAPTGNQQIVVRIGGVDSKPLLLPIQ